MRIRFTGAARRRLVVFEDGRQVMAFRHDPEHGGKGTVIEVPEALGAKLCETPFWVKESSTTKKADKTPSGGKE